MHSVEKQHAIEGGGQPQLHLVLCGLQSPINIGMILRAAETFDVRVCIVGSDSVIQSADKKKIISDFSCGALDRVGYRRIEKISNIREIFNGYSIIGTSIEEGATMLPNFKFSRNSVVIVGNEYDGLPQEIAEICSVLISIPMAKVWTPKPPSHDPIDPLRKAPVARDGRPNLNVAVASSIICYDWFLRRRHSEPKTL